MGKLSKQLNPACWLWGRPFRDHPTQCGCWSLTAAACCHSVLDDLEMTPARSQNAVCRGNLNDASSRDPLWWTLPTLLFHYIYRDPLLYCTESAKGSHGLLRYASTSCFGGNPALTTPCPKVNKDEKDDSGGVGVHEMSKMPIIKRGFILQGSCLNYNLERYSCFVENIDIVGSGGVGSPEIKETRQDCLCVCVPAYVCVVNNCTMYMCLKRIVPQFLDVQESLAPTHVRCRLVGWDFRFDRRRKNCGIIPRMCAVEHVHMCFYACVCVYKCINAF